MKFISFEGSTGIYGAVVFPGACRRYGHLLNGGRPCILKGVVTADFGALTLRVEWVGTPARQ